MVRSGSIIALDWDGTCVYNVWPKRNGEWLPGAVETIRELLDSGVSITIHSSRIAPVLKTGRRRTKSSINREIASIRKKLDKAGLHEVQIHTAPWKPAADVYLDDKGMAFTSWDTIREELWTKLS